MKIACKFTDIPYSNGEEFYGCYIEDQRIPENKKLEFFAEHKSKKSNKDVLNIWFYNCTIQKIPKGISKIFPNLKILTIRNSKLEKIRKVDLVEYKNLQRFLCSGNQVRFLPGDLFEGFKNLEWISFWDNKLDVIEPNILDGLRKLKYVSLRDNPNYDICYSVYPDEKSNATLEEVKDQLFEKFFSSVPKNIKNYVKTSRLKFLELENSRSKVDWSGIEGQRLRTMEDQKKSNDNNLFSDFMNHIQDEKFKDFKIEIYGREFLVHKLLLAIRSPTFAEMLRNNPETENLKLAEIPINIFELIVNFLYTDELPRVQDVDFLQLFVTASHLKIEKLRNLAATLFYDQISQENAFEVYKLSDKFGHDGLRQKSFEEIKKKYKNIKFKDEWSTDANKVMEIVQTAEKLKSLIDE